MMTHRELVLRAERWLLKTKGCGFAFRELTPANGEIPDAIGWKNKCVSILVECKTSKADFLSDKHKYFRRDSYRGMGKYRYYMCPKGVIKPEELPQGWGLLYCLKNIIRKVKDAVYQECDQAAEIGLLVSALRRVHIHGDLEKIYDYEQIKKPEPECDKCDHGAINCRYAANVLVAWDYCLCPAGQKLREDG